jgi:type IV pilus assembly protein PilC
VPVFVYEVADQRGSVSRGTAEAAEQQELIARLRERGQVVLPSMLARAATYDEQQVDQAVATLSSLIEPIMIVIMGAIAGSVIFALYLPIFNIGQAMKGGLR